MSGNLRFRSADAHYEGLLGRGPAVYVAQARASARSRTPTTTTENPHFLRPRPGLRNPFQAQVVEVEVEVRSPPVTCTVVVATAV